MVEIERPPAIYGFQLLQRSRSYFEAFQKLTASGEAETRAPAYFLLCHAAELALKGYLASRRIPEQRLHGYRHRLGKILAACYRHGLEQNDRLDQLIGNLVDMNNDDDFRYPSHHRLEVEDAVVCGRTMEGLYAAISTQIRANDVAYKGLLSELHDAGEFNLVRPKRRRSVLAEI